MAATALIVRPSVLRWNLSGPLGCSNLFGQKRRSAHLGLSASCDVSSYLP